MSTSTVFVLYETASGYGLFKRTSVLSDSDANNSDFTAFGSSCKLISFTPFKSAAHALENMMHVSEAVCSDYLKSFLEANLPKNSVLGVADKNMAGAVKQALQLENVISDDSILETTRLLRMHGEKLISSNFKPTAASAFDLSRAQLGLGHAYSRAKVKFNVNRADNMIIQAIALLDQLDKDVNTFSMRCKEWYGWHFPELVKLVGDNDMYAKLARFILNKSELTEDKIDGIEEIVNDPILAKSIFAASQSSMGTDISPIDLLNISSFADRVISLTAYRKNLFNYLCSKMSVVAPNLCALIGEMVGARLIAHAGSLTNLAKYPASTVQILGAEKALFRALKTKGNTPKYGLIYHSSFISKSSAKNKGRISRFLANKCSIASRIDHFIDTPTDAFGKLMKEQVDERVKFYEEGGKGGPDVMTNEKVMKEGVKRVREEGGEDDDDDEMQVSPMKKAKTEEEPKSSSKKAKKSKKDKSGSEAAPAAAPHVEEKVVVEAESPEKKKKKKKSKTAAASE